MTSVRFQGKPFSITVIQIYAPTSKAEEAETEQFYEDLNCGKFFKRWEHQTTWPASWETYLQVKKQQLELDMEQQSSSK